MEKKKDEEELSIGDVAVGVGLIALGVAAVYLLYEVISSLFGNKEANVWKCGNCGFILIKRYDKCPNCGVNIKWE